MKIKLFSMKENKNMIHDTMNFHAFFIFVLKCLIKKIIVLIKIFRCKIEKYCLVIYHCLHYVKSK